MSIVVAWVSQLWISQGEFLYREYSTVNIPLCFCVRLGARAGPAAPSSLTALLAAVPLPGAGCPAAAMMHRQAQKPAQKGWSSKFLLFTSAYE